MVAKAKKVAYFAHLEECLNKYSRAIIVGADFVGSKQMSDIRIALRGKAELMFGKNTMIRKCIRDLTKDGSHPEWQSIAPVMRGNLGFVFTNGDFADILDVLETHVKPSAAKAGVIAPVDCTIPKGPTGLDPAQTSFFQALNIATKINKGSIEIINDFQVVTQGVKVGTSEAALLVKLGIKPFEYGLSIAYVYENGIFDPSVLKITDAILSGHFATAVGNVAALSLGANFLTEASLPQLIVTGFRNVVGMALALDYLEFEQVKLAKDMIDNPGAHSGGGGGAAAAPAKGAKVAVVAAVVEEEEEEEMEFDLGF